MAEAKSNQLALSAHGFSSLPIARQAGLLIGLAASIAIGGAVAFWSNTPDFRSAFTGLAERDVMEITDALQKAGIPFKVEGAGIVTVPADQVQDARLKLAAQGLPNSTASGFELLDKSQGFGTSQFMEQARYQRALEGELAQTISGLKNVESARVHLAIPKQSAFVRNQKKPRASVFLNLYAGRNLDEGQVAAIVHMVASSIPNLDSDEVSVIDQKGRLLTNPSDDTQLGMTSNQFAYRKKLEEHLTQRVESLLTPIVGMGAMTAQVTAELDFTMTEQTQESFNPDLPAVRSEQTSEERLGGSQSASGTPGALTNQPPAGGTAVAGGQTAGAAPAQSAETSVIGNRNVTRNYELDRTISHVRMPTGSVRRLSVAVVVDHKQITDQNGQVTRQALSAEEMARITSLVKEAVGFDERRGDSVSVVNEVFNVPTDAVELPPVPLLEQPWVWQAAKIAVGVLAVLFAFFGVIRPIMRSLAERGAAIAPPALPLDPSMMTPDQLALAGPSGHAPQLTHQPTGSYEANIGSVQSMVQQDPKRVAQVVKQWLNEDGG